MTLLVGLGNPGTKYQKNRHNIGFMLIDKLIDELNARNISKSQFRGELFKSGNLLLLKPTTFMNLSGESVIAVKNYYKIDNEDIFVFHDELDLPLGSIRIKIGGGSGGHNGIKSIDQHISNEYYRIRMGIGRPIQKQDVVNYVLSDFEKSESECLNKILDLSSKIALKLSDLTIDEIKREYQLKRSIC